MKQKDRTRTCNTTRHTSYCNLFCPSTTYRTCPSPISIEYRLVQVKRRKFIPRPKSTPFFRVRPWNFARLLWALTKRPDLTWFFSFSFCMIFRQLRWFGKFGPNLDPLRPKVFGGKKTEVRPRDGLKRTRVQILRVHLLETGVDTWTSVRKTCEIRVVAFNYLVSA